VTEKRSVSLSGHRTSVALEPEFWAAVDRLVETKAISLAAFVGQVDRQRRGKNLASALRLTVLKELEATLAPRAEAGVAEKRPMVVGLRAFN
jgi:predicted DNA-binding ribbon-helix-helix protein